MPFDRAYYQRFYHDPRTAVTSRAEMRDRAALIAACVRYTGLPVKRILDAGCGVGLLRAPLRRLLPQARYIGLEVSAYLCRRYGWQHGTLQSLDTRERYELVICYDVLQYLSAAEARKAIARLARVCRGALYFGALTSGDWRNNCDQSRTDRIPGLRSAAWYRRELARAFVPLGCGMWLRRGAPVTLWDLDGAR
jgi:SAM-dependent methyltransferase